MKNFWHDFARNDRDLASPEWHGMVLEDREKKLASGEDSLLDWDAAKRQLHLQLVPKGTLGN